MTAYHPWRAVPERGDIAFVSDLPAGMRGRTCGNRIEINSRLLSAERRCAVTHEPVHHERGSPYSTASYSHARRWSLNEPQHADSSHSTKYSTSSN